MTIDDFWREFVKELDEVFQKGRISSGEFTKLSWWVFITSYYYYEAYLFILKVTSDIWAVRTLDLENRTVYIRAHLHTSCGIF